MSLDVRVIFNPDGSLSGRPVLVNPPQDPAGARTRKARCARCCNAIRCTCRRNMRRISSNGRPRRSTSTQRVRWADGQSIQNPASRRRAKPSTGALHGARSRRARRGVAGRAPGRERRGRRLGKSSRRERRASGAAPWRRRRRRSPVAAPPKPAPQRRAAAPAPRRRRRRAPAPTPPAPPVGREADGRAMSAALAAAFDAWLIGAYRQCWKAPKTPPDGEPYFPKVRVAFKADGALAAPPQLVNPPSDPAWRPHAEAALRAVKAATRSTCPTNTRPITGSGRPRPSISTPRGR